MKNYPYTLKKNDLIAIYGPSSPDKKVSQIKEIEAYLINLGYRVEILDSTKGYKHYLIASDEQKIKDLHYAFNNKDIKAILCYKGGYSAFRILDDIDYNIIKNNPKIFIGFSDVTALLNTLYLKCNLITFHGPMANFILKEDKFTNDNLFNALSNNTSHELVSANELVIINKGIAEGDLVGGNLSLIISMIGTEYEIDLDNKILFIEDVEEEPYRIERMLNQLIHTKSFKKLNGILFGTFNDCNTNDPIAKNTVENVIDEFIKPTGLPCLANFSSGHELSFTTLPIGCKIRMDATNKIVVMLEQALK